MSSSVSLPPLPRALGAFGSFRPPRGQCPPQVTAVARPGLGRGVKLPGGRGAQSLASPPRPSVPVAKEALLPRRCAAPPLTPCVCLPASPPPRSLQGEPPRPPSLRSNAQSPAPPPPRITPWPHHPHHNDKGASSSLVIADADRASPPAPAGTVSLGSPAKLLGPSVSSGVRLPPCPGAALLGVAPS